MNTQQINTSRYLALHVWTIAIILPNACHRTIARFCNRQDAEDHPRVLRRFVPKATFEIVFDPDWSKEAIGGWGCDRISVKVWCATKKAKYFPENHNCVAHSNNLATLVEINSSSEIWVGNPVLIGRLDKDFRLRSQYHNRSVRLWAWH